MSGLYLLINLAVVGVPLAFSWHPRLRFVDRWRDFVPASLLVLAGFVTWDVIFTAGGVWGFNAEYLVGPSVAGLPVEEWMFFVCIPYACVFTYHALGRLRSESGATYWPAVLAGTIALFCVGVAVTHSGRLYTVSTFSLTALFLAGMMLGRPVWAARFWVSLLFLVPPFLVTNGVLTGLRFWEYPIWNMAPCTVVDQVVWYDNAHNLGLRIMSVPVDDFFYSVLLIGLNVALFEFFGRRRAARMLQDDPGGEVEVAIQHPGQYRDQ